MKSISKYFFIALAFLALAALLRYWIGPLSERLPADYSNETILSETNQFRGSPTGEWQASTLNVRRVDQTITNLGQASIIEGALHIYHASGEINFETTNLYGIERRTRLNMAGYGDVTRTGQYLFPPHVQRIEYPIWDPMFIGLRQAAFDHVEIFEGLQVYVFTFSGTGMDETAGYNYLADVPEHYLVQTDGEGTIWVEPLSGMVVDYEDSGVSYFIAPANGVRIADFNQWTEKYTPETRTAQLALARTARLRILLLEIWLPGASMLAGLIWLSVGSLMYRKKKNLLARAGTGTTSQAVLL
jgi:hypothetical protein